MEISGYDNVVYSNREFKSVVVEFERLISGIWGSLVSNWPIDQLEPSPRFERFYSKDSEMTELHEKEGFNSKLGGQGCLGLIGVQYEQIDLMAAIEYELLPESDYGSPEPYKSRIVLSNCWQYTLITPGDVETESFSRTVFESFIEILNEGTGSNN